MKRHISKLLCIIMLVAMMFTLASCSAALGNILGSQEEHTHVYSDAWSVDETNHWHKATCTDGDDCATVTASVAAHADADKDSVCDVCGYDYDHTHTYATTYSTDANSHWYAVTCGCSIEVSGKASHVDAANDGVCDVCAYDGDHDHDYADDWSMDETNHWHASDCGHNVVADSDAHDLDDMGLCSVCGYVEGEYISVAKAIEMGTFYKDLVKNGAVVYAYDPYGEGIYSSEATYEFGENVTYVYDSNSEYSYWYSMDGELFFPVMEYVNYKKELVAAIDSSAESGAMNGYGFNKVFYYSGDDTYYGAEGLVAGLYELGLTKPNGDFEEHIVIVDGITTYTFSFTWAYENWSGAIELYEVQVVFTLSENYSIESVAVVTNCYMDSESAQVVFPNEADAADEAVEGDENEAKTYYANAFAPAAVYTYTVAQVEGERTLKNKYVADELLVSDFTVVDSTNTPVDTINAEAGVAVYLYLANVAPETANLALENIEVKCDDGAVYGFYSTYEEYIYLSATKAGTYEVTISTTKVTKTYDLVVEYQDTTSITPVIENASTTEYDCYNDATGGATVVFGAVANSYADASYTAMLPVTAVGATITANEDGTYTFVSTTTGTWQILLTSTVNSAVSSVLTINVNEAPNVADVLKGEFETTISPSWEIEYVINTVLTPAEDGALNGTMFITYSSSVYDWNEFAYVTTEVTETMTYTYADGAITVESVNVVGAAESIGLTFALNAKYELTVSGAAFTNVAMTYIPPVTLNADVLTGSYDVKFYGDTMYTLTFAPASEGAQNGVLTVVDNNAGTHTGDYNYSYVAGGEIVITDSEGAAAGFELTVASATSFLWDGNANFTVERAVVTQLEGSGTSADPYIIKADGEFNITATSSGVYYTVVAPADGTIVVSVTAGALIVNPSEGPYDNPCTVEVSANDEFSFMVCYETEECDVTVTINVPESSSSLDEAILLNGAWESTVTTSDGWPAYALIFDYSYANDAELSATPDFTYEISGNNIIITFAAKYNYTGALAGATFVYNESDNTIVATTTSGDEIVFNKVTY